MIKITTNEQNLYLLAQRMNEFYKEYDYYDYRDQLEIGQTDEDSILSIYDSLKDHDTILAAAAWLEVAISEENMTEAQRHEARTILVGLKNQLTERELLDFERDGHGSSAPIPDQNIWTPQLGEAVLLEDKLYIICSFLIDSVMLHAPVPPRGHSEERYLPEQQMIDLARQDPRNRWLFCDPPSQEYLRERQQQINAGIDALSPDQKRIVQAMERIDAYYDPERYDAADPIVFREGSILGRASFWPSWESVQNMLESLNYDRQPGLRAEIRAILHPYEHIREKEDQHMDLSIRPMEAIEQSFSYTQSEDILKQSGCIGHLRVDMGSEGMSFYTRWDNHTAKLPRGFSGELDQVIHALRTDDAYGKVLSDRGELQRYCWKNPESALRDERSYGFRVDSEDYTFMLRLNPNRGEYACYCYAYEQDKLNSYLQELQQLTVVVVEPKKAPYVKKIDPGLESLQHEVGGYIEAIYPFTDEAAIVCNEEGKLEGLPLNRALRDVDGELYDVIAGTFLVVGLGEDNFASLTPEQISTYTELYQVPEAFVMADGHIAVIPIPYEATPEYTPVYTESLSYAKANHELDAYRASLQANISCRDAIENAIATHYSNNRLNPDGMQQVVNQFGTDRTLFVLANTVQQKSWDHRFSSANRAWAETVSIPKDIDSFGIDRRSQFVVSKSHTGLTDLFLSQVRREQAKSKTTDKRPSVLNKLKDASPGPSTDEPRKHKKPER